MASTSQSIRVIFRDGMDRETTAEFLAVLKFAGEISSFTGDGKAFTVEVTRPGRNAYLRDVLRQWNKEGHAKWEEVA